MNNVKIGRSGLEIVCNEQEPVVAIKMEEGNGIVTFGADGRITTTWTELQDVPKDPRLQKMEEALRAILIESTRVERGNTVSLVDDLIKIRDIAYAGLGGAV